MVETKSTETMVEDKKESVRTSPLLMKHGTFSAYLIVAREAVVMGKVYDHHATENLPQNETSVAVITSKKKSIGSR